MAWFKKERPMKNPPKKVEPPAGNPNQPPSEEVVFPPAAHQEVAGVEVHFEFEEQTFLDGTVSYQVTIPPFRYEGVMIGHTDAYSYKMQSIVCSAATQWEAIDMAKRRVYEQMKKVPKKTKTVKKFTVEL